MDAQPLEGAELRMDDRQANQQEEDQHCFLVFRILHKITHKH
jgi:hypothetical protein